MSRPWLPEEELAALRSEVEAVRDEMRAAKQARRIDAFSEGAVNEWAARLDKALGVETPKED